MRVLIAIGVSVLVHLVLAAGLWWYFTAVPSTAVLAQMDLSSVELSLAEEDAATALPVTSLPSPSPAARPRSEAPSPSDFKPEPVDPTMPALAEPKLPEPDVPELPELHRIKQVRPVLCEEYRPTVAPKQAKVDAPPRPKRTIRPDYPRGARLRMEEGDVALEICIGADGEVGEVRVVGGCGFAELEEAAVKAVKAARFTPAKSDRGNVASVARLKFTFKLK